MEIEKVNKTIKYLSPFTLIMSLYAVALPAAEAIEEIVVTAKNANKPSTMCP